MCRTSLQNRASLKTLLPASIVGSTIFYTITNAFSWLSDQVTRKIGRTDQALTVGLLSIVADAMLDVFSAIHSISDLSSLCCSFFPRTLAEARRDSRAAFRARLTAMAAAGAARRSRDALPDAVDPCVSRNAPVSSISAEDRRFCHLHRPGSGRDRCRRGRW